MSETDRVPELLLEKLSLGELEEGEAQAVRAALEREPDGQQRLQAIERTNREILARYPAAPALVAIRRRAERAKRRRRLAVAVPAMAAAAVAALVFLGPVLRLADHPDSSTDGLREKGSVRKKGAADLTIFRKTSKGHEQLGDGGSVRAGDLLQLKVRSGRERHGVVLSTDGRGEVTLHFPAAPNGSTRLEPGAARMLRFAYQLDDAPSFERFFLVTAADPIDVKAVLAAARAVGPRKGAPLRLAVRAQIKEVLLLKPTRIGGPR